MKIFKIRQIYSTLLSEGIIPKDYIRRHPGSKADIAKWRELKNIYKDKIFSLDDYINSPDELSKAIQDFIVNNQSPTPEYEEINLKEYRGDNNARLYVAYNWTANYDISNHYDIDDKETFKRPRWCTASSDAANAWKCYNDIENLECAFILTNKRDQNVRFNITDINTAVLAAVINMNYKPSLEDLFKEIRDSDNAHQFNAADEIAKYFPKLGKNNNKLLTKILTDKLRKLCNAREIKFEMNLIDAIGSGNSKIVKMVLDNYPKIDINLADETASTVKDNPLLIAAGRHDAPVVELLLKKGADPNYKNAYGMNALHLALIDTNNADINLANKMKTIEALLKAGCSANTYAMVSDNKNKVTPLHMAVRDELTDIVKLMLKYNANPLLPDKYGATALDYAYFAEDPEIKNAIDKFARTYHGHQF